jgi:rubrerythrin
MCDVGGRVVLRTPDEILKKALEKETEASEFYADLAANCSVEFVRELLYRLQSEERKHMKMIRDMLARLEAGHSVPERK